MSIEENLFTYQVEEVVRVVDGDTVDALVDLGFNVKIKIRIRLNGINAPESRTRDKNEKKLGLAAKERLSELCGEKLLLKSYGIGKYGRVLGELFDDGVSVNNVLVAEGHAEEYHGGAR
jgi:micrococcal nuclease